MKITAEVDENSPLKKNLFFFHFLLTKYGTQTNQLSKTYCVNITDYYITIK